MSRLGVCSPSPATALCSAASIWDRRRKVHLRRRVTRISCSADFKVLTSVTSNYNNIVILDTPDSRVLLLDSSSMLSIIQFYKTKFDKITQNFSEFNFLLVQIMCIAFFTRGRSGRMHIGYDIVVVFYNCFLALLKSKCIVRVVHKYAL